MPEVQSRTYANPRRLPRRNHYQEGPDFLFVATQGGRPPGDIDLRDLATVVRRRRAALRRWADGEPFSSHASKTRVPPARPSPGSSGRFSPHELRSRSPERE